jgi:hypothetical protein
MEKPAKRYMLNTITKVVWDYDPQAIKLNRDLVECNEIGVPIGRPETVTDELYGKIIDLEGEVAEKNLRIAALESRLAEAEALLKAATVNARKEALGDMTIKELKKVADGMNLDIPNSADKAEIVDMIYAAELVAQNPIETAPGSEE